MPMDVLTRTGLVLEPSTSSKTNLAIMRGDNGILFRMIDVTYGKEIPIGDVVVEWPKVDELIAKLVEFRDAKLPKRYFIDLDPGNFGLGDSN